MSELAQPMLLRGWPRRLEEGHQPAFSIWFIWGAGACHDREPRRAQLLLSVVRVTALVPVPRRLLSRLRLSQRLAQCCKVAGLDGREAARLAAFDG
jgi:hypothetical protein